ncbi:beta strand repeat-containing protein [Nostoc sp.]|uniref:beta strand repeat-containing protein n=1 Tax=Nostoc sp. TaxID=1180 RepID=UPI002FF94954
MTNIIGTNGNDTLSGGVDSDTINGKAGNDTIYIYNDYRSGGDTLTGGGGKDEFVYSSGYNNIITDFSGVGKGTNPTAAVIAEVDTLNLQDYGFTVRNLLLTQNGNNLEISFEGNPTETRFMAAKVILQNFKLENLENLKASGATPAIGNIVFFGQTSITDSFDVLDANSTDTSIGIKNTVTFLNDLSNNIVGLDNSDDVINGQGGNDIIDGKSGNDLLRGGPGNDSLLGGAGNDTLVGGTGNDFLTGNDSLIGGAGNDYLNVEFSTANNILNGDAGDDTLDAGASSGNNFLSGGDGNDYLSTSNVVSGYISYPSSSNNTLNGGAGDDTLNAQSPKNGNNLLCGGDGNDSLSTSGVSTYRGDAPNFSSSGNNTLNGGAGNDTLRAEYSTGNNFLSGGDGNDYLSVSAYFFGYSGGSLYLSSSGNNTLNGGAGDDTLGAEHSTGSNFLSGGDGNDSFSLSPTFADTAPSYFVTQTVDGGKGDDLLSVDYTLATGGIITTINPTTTISSIKAGKYGVNYKNIERLNISGTAYNDNIVGSNGNDTLSTGTSGKDTIDGGKGDDVLSIDYSNATGGITTTFNATTNIGAITAGTSQVSYKNIERLNISGTAYNDNIVGSNGNDTLSTSTSGSTGTSGKDTINGGKGDDVLFVDYNNATGGITTTFNATTNIGAITAGASRVSYKNIERLNISGTAYNDNIVGNSGNDTLDGGYGYGNDTIDGGAGNDRLIVRDSSRSDNLLSGGDGNDTLTASQAYGKNTLIGGNGNDYLTGGFGNDSLYGGTGTDTFAFNGYSGGVDRLYDFNATNELIQVSAAGFGGGLSIGSLQKNQFTLGTSATTSNQRFIYNNITGALFFDQDGSASGFSQVKFAQLSAGVTLTINNFVVF